MIKTARAVGVLFLVSTAAYLIGSGILDPILHRTDALDSLYPERARAYAGLFLESINALAVVGIAMLLYPILKQSHEALALGYFGSRVIESALLLVSLIGPLVLIKLNPSTTAEGASVDSSLQAAGRLAIEAHDLLFELAMIALGAGSLLLCYMFYRTRLVPRTLSVIGFIGYACLLASSCLSIAGLESGVILYAPGAVFEIALPVWLIVKGFRFPRA